MSNEEMDKVFIGMVITGLVMVSVASIVKLILWIIIWG